MTILAERFEFTKLFSIAFLLCVLAMPARAENLPNILWLVAEDISPHLGCYGDTYSVSPNIDRLASQGLRYTNCWSNAPVCAPARTALLMGMFPPSLGAHHMRSEVPIPDSLKPYPFLLREKGYFTTNNSKTDYNVTVDMGKLWNQNGNQAHWRNRQPGQPFFAVFNFEISHESQIRNNNTLAENRRHDPAKVRVPAYHPDTPEVRKDWAQYYDRITQLDDQIQRRLNELDEAGLAEETIVFFYGDNGSGMPRSKRTVLQTGQGVPLIIRFPEKFKHLAPKEYAAAGVSERLVSFVDFAPTLLSLIGEKTPETMHGKAFAGQFDAGSQPYIFGFRGRMDERYDGSRSVRDDRFVLALNLYPHIPFGARNDYMFQTPTAPIWKKLYDEGKLPPEQAFFFEMKPPVELYDLKADPDQVRNLAHQPEYQGHRDRLLTALLQHMYDVRDTGFMPEAMIYERAEDSTPYEMARDPQKYDFETVANTWLRNFASASFSFQQGTLQNHRGSTLIFIDPTEVKDDAVWYWDAIGMLNQIARSAGADGTKPTAMSLQHVQPLRPVLEKLMEHENQIVRIPAAEALGRYGTEADVAKAERILLDIAADRSPPSFHRTLLAFNSLDYFSYRITEPDFGDRLKAAAEFTTPLPRRASPTYMERIVESILP